MSVRPRSHRPAAQRKRAERFIERAFANEIQAKAALIVIHRVYQSIGTAEFDPAMEKLVTFAKAHPLPGSLEKLL